jgi:hypothetical protein
MAKPTTETDSHVFVDYNGVSVRDQDTRAKMAHTHSPRVFVIYEHGAQALVLHPGFNRVPADLWAKHKAQPQLAALIKSREVKVLAAAPTGGDDADISILERSYNHESLTWLAQHIEQLDAADGSDGARDFALDAIRKQLGKGTAAVTKYIYVAPPRQPAQAPASPA